MDSSDSFQDHITCISFKKYSFHVACVWEIHTCLKSSTEEIHISGAACEWKDRNSSISTTVVLNLDSIKTQGFGESVSGSVQVCVRSVRQGCQLH